MSRCTTYHAKPHLGFSLCSNQKAFRLKLHLNIPVHLTLTLVQIYLECVQAEAIEEVVQERNKFLEPSFRNQDRYKGKNNLYCNTVYIMVIEIFP